MPARTCRDRAYLPAGGPREPLFVALHRDERAPSRPVWVPVRGDRGCTGEVSWRRAARRHDLAFSQPKLYQRRAPYMILAPHHTENL